MIPKIIHYCWLSGEEMPALNKQCLESWQKLLPDYQLMLWDTRQIDIHSNQWLEQAYQNRKWAFAADYIRFYALWNYGGIYLDADVEVLKSFSPLMERPYFVGYQCDDVPEAAVIAAEPHCAWVGECLDYYKDRQFVKADGSFDMTALPNLVQRVLKKHGITPMPAYYFSPKEHYSRMLFVNDETYCIHHFDGKWAANTAGVGLAKVYIHRFLIKCFGLKFHNKVVRGIRSLHG